MCNLWAEKIRFSLSLLFTFCNGDMNIPLNSDYCLQWLMLFYSKMNVPLSTKTGTWWWPRLLIHGEGWAISDQKNCKRPSVANVSYFCPLTPPTSPWHQKSFLYHIDKIFAVRQTKTEEVIWHQPEGNSSGRVSYATSQLSKEGKFDIRMSEAFRRKFYCYLRQLELNWAWSSSCSVFLNILGN